MLDRRERAGDLFAGLLAVQQTWSGELWTAMPGIIQSFDAAKKSCVVQPALKALVQAPDGATQWVTMPLLLDCPVLFPSGGGITLTFPLAQGNECLVIFADRCIDAWWQSGGVQAQAELRLHDLSDGFVIPGISSKPLVEPAISTDGAELRSTDGTYKVRLKPGERVEMVAPGASVKVTPNRVDLTGALWINGSQYLAHTHPDAQGGITGGVNP